MTLSLQQLAAEYVLGTLPVAQRRDVERRLPDEPLLRAEVAAWERRLLPLTALAEPVEPSPGLWPRIAATVRASTVASAPAAANSAAVNSAAANSAESSAAGARAAADRHGASPAAGTMTRTPLSRWRRWWDDVRLWRGLSAGAVAATLTLAVTLAWQEQAPADARPAYMVVLVAPQERTAGYVVQTSMNRQLRLTPLQGVQVPGGKSLQFWTKGSDWRAPVSLGLVQPGQPLTLALDRLPPVQPDQLFEITLEPAAGSPTGKPTGPVLYIGKAIKVM